MQTYAVEHPKIIPPFDSGRLWNVPHWFALYTRSRHEKLVQHELHKKGIQSFLPLRRIIRNWSDRRKLIEMPLFSSYIFIHTPLSERLNVLTTTGVVRFLGLPSRPVPIRESDIQAVRRFVEQEIDVDPFPYLKEGMKVYVKSGPFKGIEGFIVRKDNHCRLVVSLDVLMQSISVEIDQACIEAV